VECPGIGEFEEGGGIADIDGEDSESSNIGRISWDTSDLCETFHFSFETSEGAPATTVPDIRIDHLESFQVVRVSLDVEAALVTDQLVETNLVDRLYVVRSLDGAMFVDLHLSQPAAVRVSTMSSPARLSLDLRPGFVPFVGSSTQGEDVVVVSPSSDSVVDATTRLEGYSRIIDTEVVVVATRDGEVVAETSFATADAAGTWSEFQAEVELPPGEISVFVGEESAVDGSLEGVAVELTVN
jgi:hypothetical protein